MRRVADDDRSNRQIARSKTRKAGDRSARLARTLMELADHEIAKLELDEDLGADVRRARSVASHIARRRAERTLAGDLRRYDLAELDDKLANLRDNNAEVRTFHLAEQWRTRLVADAAVAAEFPGGATDELARLIGAAQKERDSGKPPGAGRTLFRHIVDVLKRPAE